uniref:type IX secretion system anionic LPS delivery protein PorZ n=1 Tax=Prevotella sp. TaxID=59823 RepID=UPI0040281B9E
MRKYRLLLFILFFPLLLHAQWKAYLSYYDPTEIVEGEGKTIYVLASGGLYRYDRSDQSLTTYDKISGLSDCGIAHIGWLQKAKRLVIVYDDYNIDLLSPNGDVVNMTDYQDYSTTDTKTVNGVDVSGSMAYLSTAFGIVALNVADAEITNTYRLGFSVNYSYVKDGYLYAASAANGLYRGKMTDNLLDKANWTRVGGYAAKPSTVSEELKALVKTLQPGGPKYNYFGFLKMYDGKLYSCNGTVNMDPGCIQVLSNSEWSFFQDDIASQTGINYQDVFCLDIDPRDNSHVMAGSREGLYEFRNGQFVKLWNDGNSPIESFDKKSKDYQLVFGVMYDRDGNLWALNSQAPTQSILEYTKDGEWKSFPHEELMKLKYLFPEPQSLGTLKGMMTDSRGLVWFVNDHWTVPSFYAYQAETNALNSYQGPFVNEDGTSLNITSCQCITEDKDNNMWIGTNIGPFMLETDQITAISPILTQVKVPRNDGTNYADYLLSGVNIQSIVVDKNNRKWFGTNGNGLYLIAADNITTLAHFTKTNSKLLSDNILSLALNDATGELFIGTDKGLCSYTGNFSDSSNGMTKDNVWAYPNPVKPDYTGAITVTGLENGASVKIVTSNGVLVNEGIASNGEYKWYGINRDGKRVASGVYMVEVATSEGEKGVVCKVAIVR